MGLPPALGDSCRPSHWRPFAMLGRILPAMAEPTAKPEDGVPLEIPGLKTRVPKWLAAAAVVAIGGWFVWSHVDADKARISPDTLVQLEHSNIHLTEAPADTHEVFKDARGSLLVKYYLSDACLLSERHPPLGPVATHFQPDSSLQIPTRFAINVIDGPLEAPGDFLGASPAYAEGACYPTPQAHPGAFSASAQRVADGVVRSWRRWEDGCTGYADYYERSGSWGPWVWTTCRH